MCGICGVVSLNGELSDGRALVQSMMSSIQHRGPDDGGVFVNSRAVLGHRRLSIIDLESGKQPISNEDNTVWIVFNGEIYNYRELRKDLQARGHSFRTNSDTEVIVHLYEEFGLDCLTRLRGMFSFAIWDDRTRTFVLARDRVGIKPVYYTMVGGELLFASEMKALLVDRRVSRSINLQALDDGLMHLYCPGQETLITGVHKLLPGHALVVHEEVVQIQQYWDLDFRHPADREDEESVSRRLVTLLQEVVAGHMISDVPVGVLLSGGVDSTAMLSFATEQGQQRIKTFTVGFDGDGFVDERPFARLAASRYGSDHHEMSMSAEQFWSFLPSYVWHMEEAVCEPPAVALYYVTKLARESVKVLLSGEGGDEGFAGYQNYRSLLWLERWKSLGPLAAGIAARCFAGMSRAKPHPRWQWFAKVMQEPLSTYYLSRTAAPYNSFRALRHSLYSRDLKEELAQLGGGSYSSSVASQVMSMSPLDAMLYVDTKTWLPDDLLIKADKMTMANSVELRVPLLDHRVLEFAASLPDRLKIRGLQTKYVLKNALRSRVPAEILGRPKTGFPVPFEQWMREDLSDKVREVFSDSRTTERGYFAPGAVDAVLERFKAGQRLGAEVFSLLALEFWHRRFIDDVGAAQLLKPGRDRVASR